MFLQFDQCTFPRLRELFADDPHSLNRRPVSNDFESLTITKHPMSVKTRRVGSPASNKYSSSSSADYVRDFSPTSPISESTERFLELSPSPPQTRSLNLRKHKTCDLEPEHDIAEMDYGSSHESDEIAHEIGTDSSETDYSSASDHPETTEADVEGYTFKFVNGRLSTIEDKIKGSMKENGIPGSEFEAFVANAKSSCAEEFMELQFKRRKLQNLLIDLDVERVRVEKELRRVGKDQREVESNGRMLRKMCKDLKM